jgi:hypothetical protein
MEVKNTNLKNRKIRIGRYTISALLLLLIIGSGVVFATAYVILQWTITATVVANPTVCFIRWSDGSKNNTFSYAVNIFPSIKTVDENITYGVWNWDPLLSHACHMRLASTNTNSTDVASINATIYITGTTIFTHKWTVLTDAAWSDFTPLANTKYTVWIEIECALGAGVGHTPTFSFEMKVENP